MTFGELQIGDRFKHLNSELVWTKNTPFKAYGMFMQNASVYAVPIGPWHYDKVDDATEVVKVEDACEVSESVGT